MTAVMTGPRTDELVVPGSTNVRPMLLVAALATVYVAWGSTYLAVRVMVGEMPTLTSTGLGRWLRARSWAPASWSGGGQDGCA